jgi:hypothetical protein
VLQALVTVVFAGWGLWLARAARRHGAA